MATHRSHRRQKQAEATRLDILAAARKLFAAHGYPATSLAAIAEEADTAVQTIYDSIGPKRAIVLALVAMSEEEAGVGEFQERIMETRDPREAIGRWVNMTRQFMDRGGDIFVAIQSAAPTEPDVAAAMEEARSHHRMGARQVGNLLARLDSLAAGIPAERAGDVIAVLTWGTMWQELRNDHGWSLDECETWMTGSLVKLLLRDAG